MQLDALMDSGTAALASAIGARIKQERQSRQWTLDRLAEAAGVSRRMLINVEQGTANPRVGTLLRISDAPGVVCRRWSVQHGTITVDVSDQTFTLNTGDALTLAVFEPSVGSIGYCRDS